MGIFKQKVSLLDALAIGQAVRHGEAVLVGKILVRGGEIFINWQGGPLDKYRERLKAAAKQRMAEMDNSPYWELSPEEYDRMCARYGALAEVAG